MPADPLDVEEREFQRLYVVWAPTTPGDAAALFARFERPWWISGGWAIDAFTGVARAQILDALDHPPGYATARSAGEGRASGPAIRATNALRCPDPIAPTPPGQASG